MRQYLTTTELANRLRTSPATVRYWRYTGIGPPGTKVGRRVLYDELEVQRWLDTRREAQSESRS